MFARIKSLDYKVLHNISRLHRPSLNIIMKTASRSANVGIIWWLITLPFLPRFYSFPSGHTTASFAMVGVSLLRCRVITFVPIIILAALISFSRIYLRVHYLTDVIAGVILGTTCGMLSVLFFAAIGLY